MDFYPDLFLIVDRGTSLYIICSNKPIPIQVKTLYNHCPAALHGMKRSSHVCRYRNKGFALIATISVMVLLVMIALAMLSLSSIELRAKSATDARQEARANARMALMIAIGELQKHAGPDQSITAPAGSLTAEGFARLDADESKARYMGVYNRRDEDDVERELDADSWEESRKEFFRRWMVSGNSTDVENLSYVGTGISSGNGVVKMTGKMTLDEHQVYVPTEIVEMDGRDHRIAWWVDGTGSKASLALTRETEADLKMLLPDRFGIKQASGALSWYPSEGSEEELSKIVSMQTADVLGSQLGGAEGSVAENENWLTSQHLMVLADPRRSGLKGDLTSALGESRDAMENMLGERMFLPASGKDSTPEDPGGPFWSQVRDYYNLDGSGSLPVQPQTEEQMGVFPVVASFIEVYGMSTTKRYSPTMYPHPSAVDRQYPHYYDRRDNNKDVYVFTAHMAPMVKLWNPYNRPLETSDYTFVVGNSNKHHKGNREGSYDDVILQGRNGSIPGGYDARLPKPMRFEHRYYIPQTTFAPGEVKIFSLHENRYLDLEGNYTPHSGKNLGKKTNVVGDGWILCELAEGGFRGNSLWDMHLTKPDIYSKDTLNYQGGRAIGGACPGPNVVDGGDIQILDTERPGGLEYTIRPHRFVTWNIKLYKGKVGKESGSYQTPLVNMKNVSTDVTGYSKENISFMNMDNMANDSQRFFARPGGLNAIWARRVSLRHLVNDGDDKHDLYNPTGHGTKDVKWLANYNPRSATVGCWPKSYRRSEPHQHSSFFREPTSQMKVNGTSNGGGGFGLGTTGNYLTGLTEESLSVEQLIWQPFIGYSDIEGPTQCALFDVPEGDDPARKFFSIGQLRHANLWIENGDYDKVLGNGYGDEDWFSDNMHPAYPIGSAYADPRLKFDDNMGRYLKMDIQDESGSYNSTWYDLSWFLNDRLWDKYYFSAKKDQGDEGSYNPRLISYGGQDLKEGEDGFRENAASQMVSGAFNVNSVSKEAWKAFLASLVGAGDDAQGSPFLRYTDPQGGKVDAGTGAVDDNAYLGFRELNANEIDALATQVVEEVKKRGPFMSLGDFINRATLKGAPNEYMLKGALQAAIDEAEINANFSGAEMSIEADDVSSVYEKEAYAGDIAAGVPGYLTQGDLLARTGHLMTVRSDTFTIRAYGESVDQSGKTLARAWCEAVVQRMPDYVNANDDAFEPAWNEDGSANEKVSDLSREYGRKFLITSFRWIPTAEIEGEN